MSKKQRDRDKDWHRKERERIDRARQRMRELDELLRRARCYCKSKD